ncbi:hydrolase [Nocardia nova SH22a]|uniref:Hydrolase n=1 Tax=Nocardia nova SH22a TaxID=1415166 RepID=W5TES4_9NOCA|nr:HAD-IA family hydrolase [Nocardia nova]AHH17664.1 hydrolase [Nocardia nova SH22a]
MSTLTDLLTARTCLLLDFDGPICAVFSGLTSRDAVEHLGSQLDTPLPPVISETTDPFDVLEYARGLGPATATRIERAFTRIELEAVAQSSQTPDGAELIRYASRRGYSVAVVSNNSAESISAYLDRYNLRDDIAGIFARTPANLDKFKPGPYLLDLAMQALGTNVKQTVFVGDSTTDIQAAHAAQVTSIAFANRPEKVDRFADYGPGAVITHLTDLMDALVVG